MARELTKIHEEFIRGNIEEIIEKSEFLKGEMIILIEGRQEIKIEEKQQEFKDMSLEEHYELYQKQGLNKKRLLKKLLRIEGFQKRNLYEIYFIMIFTIV